MFTVCPKCALTLAVTAADLRAGQGYVRCGRCANVFNALLGLSEETDAAQEFNPTPAPAAASPATPPAARAPEPAGSDAEDPDRTGEHEAPEHFAAQILAGSAATDDATAAPPPAGASVAIATTPPALRLIESPPRPPRPVLGDSTEVEEFRGTGTYETIVLEGDTFLQTEELVPEEALDIEIAEVSRRLAEAHDEDERQDAAAARLASVAAASGAAPSGPAPTGPASAGKDSEHQRLVRDIEAAEAAMATEEATEEAAESLRMPPGRASWQAVAAGVLLALLLVVQLVHHWRNDLATHKGLNAPLTSLYAALGRPLTPNWNLNAYDVRQLGAASDNADSSAIRVRLSLSNRARVPLGMPLVRLTLIDRYGKALSSGEVTPAQYLPGALRGQRSLDPDQHIDTEVSVTDPTQQASSFELDVCVAAPGGGLRCAGDGAAVASSAGAAP
jgi:predicted Zn finger-like uncharacterized protein